VRFGEGALDDAPGLLASRGFERFALLTTPRAGESAPAVVKAADVVLNVPHGPVPEAAAAVRGGVEGRPLVALGGGRVIDSAKAIAGADRLSAAAIPTTLSGAEMTPFHRMPAGVDEWRLVRPEVVIAEPALMVSAPAPELAASAMNALAHAIEALYTPLANPVTDMAALRAARLLTGDGPDLALGAILAGYAAGAAGFAVHHAVCQTIVRVAGTPHAQTNSVMLPYFVEMMRPRAAEALARLDEAIGPDGLSELGSRAGVTRLSELGVDESVLDEVVAAAVEHPALRNTPDPPGPGELRQVLRQAL
jgi:alcohol dehydrogenase class IV